MPRLKLKQLKIKPPPKVRVREPMAVRPLKVQEVSLVRQPARLSGPNDTKLIRKPPIVNVSKKPDLDAKKAMRERYRARTGVVLESCLDNLAQLEDFATMHSVTFPNGSVREIPAFTLTAAGEPLGTSGATITRWVKRGMLPGPVLETSRATVYHIEEVRSFIRIIGKHQQEFKQYRDDHDDVKDSIFEANAGIRKGLFSTK
jgi:hypothetical protein